MNQDANLNPLTGTIESAPPQGLYFDPDTDQNQFWKRIRAQEQATWQAQIAQAQTHAQALLYEKTLADVLRRTSPPPVDPFKHAMEAALLRASAENHRRRLGRLLAVSRVASSAAFAMGATIAVFGQPWLGLVNIILGLVGVVACELTGGTIERGPAVVPPPTIPSKADRVYDATPLLPPSHYSSLRPQPGPYSGVFSSPYTYPGTPAAPTDRIKGSSCGNL